MHSVRGHGPVNDGDFAVDNKQPFSILLVDDDSTIIFILSRILGEFTPIRFATSGRDALKLARESVPDLVLLDMELPDISGLEVCKAFKSEPALADVPVIFITSHESSQLETMGLQLGATDFITKPVRAPLVLARVRTHFRMKALSDTVRSVAAMDFLTGALNRRELEKALTHEWLRTQRSGAPLTLLLADIDGFTAYNAECGEQQGDACLKSVADALRTILQRPTDLLARYAGGKFALLLAETNVQGAQTVAQHAIDAVDALCMPHAAATNRGRITLSVGGGYRGFSRPTVDNAVVERSVRLPLAGAVADDLITAAEHALKNARYAGGHQAKFMDVANLGTAQAISVGN